MFGRRWSVVLMGENRMLELKLIQEMKAMALRAVKEISAKSCLGPE